MDLSIVIPAYKEAHKIARDVQVAAAFLGRNNLRGEVIVADDGSPDDTAQVARQAPVSLDGVERRVLALDHHGKGHAVRQGMIATRGDYVMFADSGLCVPFEDALAALDLLHDGRYDIANGSRKMRTSVINRSQTLYRRLLSRLFRCAVIHALDLPRDLTDTQCGFKVYRGDIARELYAECELDGFMFDLEVLIRARQRGYRVVEFPVHWTCDPDSRLRPSRILGPSLGELLSLRRILAQEKSRSDNLSQPTPH
ncbi:MAG: glycosyltransferase [Bacillota bacterium]